MLAILLFLVAFIILICTLWALSPTPTSSTPTPSNITTPISGLSANSSPLKEAPFPCYLTIQNNSDTLCKYLTDAEGNFKLTDRIEDATMYTYHRGDGNFLRSKGYHHSVSKYWDETYADGIDFLEGPDYVIELKYVGPYSVQAIIRTLVQDPAYNMYLIATDEGIQIQNHPQEITVFTIPNYMYNFDF